MANSLMDLSLDNLALLLSKSPIKMIHVFRCLCKTLLDLTSNSNPYFTPLHSQNATTQNLIIQFGDSNYLKNYVNLIDSDIDTIPRTTKLRLLGPVFEIPKGLNSSTSNKFALVNACNGLLYFAVKSDLERCNSFVCNPITKEHVKVPDQVERFHKQPSSSWLGFGPVSRRYKVVRVYNCSSIKAHIHDVGYSSHKSWRQVDKYTPLNHLNWNNSYAFVNGIGYWLCQENNESYFRLTDFVVSFDFESEIFRKINAPPTLNNINSQRHRELMSIGVLEDRLCLIDDCTGNINIWMMENDGGWNKRSTLVHKADIPLYFYRPKMLRPLQVLSSGEILMVSDDENLVCYDEKTSNLRLIDLHKMKPYFSVVTFVPSFVLLKDALRGS